MKGVYELDASCVEGKLCFCYDFSRFFPKYVMMFFVILSGVYLRALHRRFFADSDNEELYDLIFSEYDITIDSSTDQISKSL